MFVVCSIVWCLSASIGTFVCLKVISVCVFGLMGLGSVCILVCECSDRFKICLCVCLILACLFVFLLAFVLF